MSKCGFVKLCLLRAWLFPLLLFWEESMFTSNETDDASERQTEPVLKLSGYAVEHSSTSGPDLHPEHLEGKLWQCGSKWITLSVDAATEYMKQKNQQGSTSKPFIRWSLFMDKPSGLYFLWARQVPSTLLFHFLGIFTVAL
jgi:hypothetical protein